MRIRSVTAQAFGPLADETLQLADGMTVVVGDNESAKSSWHAAIYAALCGRRRGKGAPRKDEQRFIELHKPWDRDDWLVTAEVVLDDGRRVELRHDLAGKVDCHAKDLVLGDDISAEVMNDGAPDGARWLGLDRSSFAATACVEQAHMLRVLTDADGLQEHLQRAAATAGTDATAAAALDRLEEFKRERVGLDRVNSSKPLRRAMNAEQAAGSALDEAHAAHEEYLSRLEQVEKLHERAVAAQQAVAAHEAAAAAYDAAQLTERLREAEELSERFGGVRPVNVADDDQVANEVSKALASWRSAPVPAGKPTPSSADFDEQLAALPAAPDGDTAVHESVRRAEEHVTRVQAQLEQHDRNRPGTAVSPPPQVAAGDDELLDLARVLEMPVPAVPAELLERERAAQTAVSTPAPAKLPVPLLIAAAVAVLIGVIAVALGQLPVGAAVAAVGVIVGAVAVLRRRPTGPDEQTLTAAASAHAAAAAAREQVTEAQHRRERAVARCAELGLPAEPEAVRAVPTARNREQAHVEELRRWTEHRDPLVAELSAAVGELAGALSARGHAADGTDPAALLEAADAYRLACDSRAQQAAAASRRPDLVQQRDAALAAERRLVEDAQARDTAAGNLLAAAKLCAVAADTPEQAEAALLEWQGLRAARLSQLDADQEDWTRLQSRLDGRTLDELRDLAEAASAKAAALAAQVSPDAVAAVDPATAADRLPVLREEVTEAGNRAAAASGELRLYAATIPNVSEAEETLEQAVGELGRVRELQRTLELTTSFLTAAQDRVHRDIAPRLADTVRAWLPKVTGGRYTDVIVSPTTLQVQVAGASGKWRYADALSYGTAEQVYLLLRVALADHLTKGHDTCPLLLDDITVHADAARTGEILDLLLELSKERQIVVFTQEKQVAAWAREHLTGPDQAMVELASPTAA